MKKQLLKSALVAVVGVGLMAGYAINAMAAPFVTGPWQDYEYYQADVPPGQVATDRVKYYFDFDLAFLNLNDPGTNSALILQNDVQDYGKEWGTIQVQDLWATLAIFSEVTEAEHWNLKVYAAVNDTTYDLGNGFLQLGPEANYYTASYQFTGALLDAWKLDPYGSVTLSVETSAPKFHLVEVGMGVSPVPEPTTMLLFGSGLLGLAAIARRRKS